MKTKDAMEIRVDYVVSLSVTGKEQDMNEHLLLQLVRNRLTGSFKSRYGAHSNVTIKAITVDKKKSSIEDRLDDLERSIERLDDSILSLDR